MDAEIARNAWHDVVCPEGLECRSRDLHARSEPVYTSGVLERFVVLYEKRILNPNVHPLTVTDHSVCPVCGGAVQSIERRPEGKRVCVNGDVWQIVNGHAQITARVRKED